MEPFESRRFEFIWSTELLVKRINLLKNFISLTGGFQVVEQRKIFYYLVVVLYHLKATRIIMTKLIPIPLISSFY